VRHSTATTVGHLLAKVPVVDTASVDPETGFRGTRSPDPALEGWCRTVQASYPKLRLLGLRYDELAPVATVGAWTDARDATLRVVRPVARDTAWLAAFAATPVGLLAVFGLGSVALGLGALVVVAGIVATVDLARVAAGAFAEDLDRYAELYRNGMVFPESENATDRLRRLTRHGVDLTNREIHRLAQEIATTDPAAADVFVTVLHGSDRRVVDAARIAIATTHWAPGAVAA
jgi:hypothetical protein